jgi:hypothetical protein
MQGVFGGGRCRSGGGADHGRRDPRAEAGVEVMMDRAREGDRLDREDRELELLNRRPSGGGTRRAGEVTPRSARREKRGPTSSGRRGYRFALTPRASYAILRRG